MAKIEEHKYTISEAFQQCFYVVPSYQREYVWQTREVQQLMEDINEQVDNGNSHEYFIGTVLVSPIDGKNNHYDIIDGQQRLTTFFLLLCVLKNLFQDERDRQYLTSLISQHYPDKNGNIQTALKLEPCYENASEVMSRIVELSADPQATYAGIQSAGIPSFGSLENLLNAYETIYRYLKDNYDDVTKLRKYWGYLANNVVFIQISTEISSALKIFETINERGIGLNPMDLLKNLLFTQVKQQQFEQLKDEWKKITAPLEKNKEKPLRFLRYFLMANYKIHNNRGDSVVREDEIYDWFRNPNNAALCDYANKPFEFVRKIIRNVELYLKFAEGNGNDGKPNIAMDNLRRLCGGAFSLHFVLLLAASSFPKVLFDHFVAQLESFLFYYIFTKTPTKDLERNFSIWADELRAISGAANDQQQKSMLNVFIADKFQKNMDSKDVELSDNLKRYTLQTMQQYRTRYLLAKLTQYVEMAYKGLESGGLLHEYAALEIEHILPNNPESDLRAAFIAANPGCNYDIYKNKLGNLTLLEKPINIVASNDFYSAKKVEYSKCSYYLTRSLAGLTTVGSDTSINRINQKLAAFDVWTATNIDQRHALLIDMAKDIWKTESIEVAKS